MMNNNNMLTDGEMMAWYHSKILRIPHGNQNPTKRYLNENQVYSFFEDSKVTIQEKVDGKLSCYSFTGDDGEKITQIYEDMTNKNTCHDHIVKYDNLPDDKKIYLDRMIQYSCVDEPFIVTRSNALNIAIIDFRERDLPSIDILFGILDSISKIPSKFGSDMIEGLVLKKIDENGCVISFAKWINDEFEDKLND